MSHRERDSFFGGSALLIAVIQARGLRSADSNGLSDPYVTIVPLDETGHEISEEKAVTRTVAKTLDPEWCVLSAAVGFLRRFSATRTLIACFAFVYCLSQG